MVSQSDLRHLLRRTEFVARPARLAALSSLSLEQAVDDILDTAPNGPPSLPAGATDPNPANRWTQYAQGYQWWVDSMATKPRPLQEKMTLFWHGHFTSSTSDGVPFDLMMRQNHLYRSLAYGNLRELTQRMAVEPAMIGYLSNASNVVGAPNENFARELFELFTLGIGNYAESDVAASARAWTGHGLGGSHRAYVFRPQQHDGGQKTIFGVTKNWNGPDVIDEIFANPSKRPVVARFIVRKLWEFFAHAGPSDVLVQQLADTFLANDFSIRAVLRAMFLRPEFYSTDARNGLVRSPTEWVVALMYHAGPTCSDLWLESRAETIGQVLFSPPNVAGWKGNSAWTTTSALSGRAEIAKTVVWWTLRAGGRFDDLSTVSVDVAVDRVAAFFDVELTPTTRAALVAHQQAERTAGDDPWWGPTNLLLLTLLSPEFNLA